MKRLNKYPVFSTLLLVLALWISCAAYAADPKDDDDHDKASETADKASSTDAKPSQPSGASVSALAGDVEVDKETKVRKAFGKAIPQDKSPEKRARIFEIISKKPDKPRDGKQEAPKKPEEQVKEIVAKIPKDILSDKERADLTKELTAAAKEPEGLDRVRKVAKELKASAEPDSGSTPGDGKTPGENPPSSSQNPGEKPENGAQANSKEGADKAKADADKAKGEGDKSGKEPSAEDKASADKKAQEQAQAQAFQQAAQNAAIQNALQQQQQGKNDQGKSDGGGKGDGGAGGGGGNNAGSPPPPPPESPSQLQGLDQILNNLPKDKGSEKKFGDLAALFPTSTPDKEKEKKESSSPARGVGLDSSDKETTSRLDDLKPKTAKKADTKDQTFDPNQAPIPDLGGNPFTNPVGTPVGAALAALGSSNIPQRINSADGAGGLPFDPGGGPPDGGGGPFGGGNITKGGGQGSGAGGGGDEPNWNSIGAMAYNGPSGPSGFNTQKTDASFYGTASAGEGSGEGGGGDGEGGNEGGDAPELAKNYRKVTPGEQILVIASNDPARGEAKNAFDVLRGRMSARLGYSPQTVMANRGGAIAKETPPHIPSKLKGDNICNGPLSAEIALCRRFDLVNAPAKGAPVGMPVLSGASPI